VDTRTNEYGQPIGPALDFTPAKPPSPVVLEGRGVRLEPVAREHTAGLYAALCSARDEPLWTYRSDERPRTVAEMAERIDAYAARRDVVTFAIVPTETGQAAGLASLMRADVANGSIEVGAIVYGRSLQRSRGATEAMSLLMHHVFDDLGYRRYEWKCDKHNQPSRRAAVRLGFIWEGRFRNAVAYKGRSRDTDWFSITDSEWPRVRRALEEWLDDRNFDERGHQRVRLAARPPKPGT
jgi:RimJ/RimL family protein N-acetyltransferase